MPAPLNTSKTGHRALAHGALALVWLAAGLLAGCAWVPPFLSPDFNWTYKIDIQQGVVVTQEMAEQLKPGMSQDQVKFIMGSPPLIDPYHANRWDYPYVFEPGRGPTEARRFTVFFENGKMTRIAGDPLPTEKEFVASRIRINAKEAKPIAYGDDKRYAPKPGTEEDSGAAPAQPASSGADSSGSNTPSESAAESSSPSLWQRITNVFGSSSRPSAPPDTGGPPPSPGPSGAGSTGTN